MITLTNKQEDFENIYFVSGALSIKSTYRAYKTVLKVENDKIYATDGGRLHVANIKMLKDGFYQIIKRTKTLMVLENAECDSYPNLNDIFQIDYKHNIDTGHLDYNTEKEMGFCYQIALINRSGFIVIPKQINDIMSFGDFEISYHKTTEPLFFKHNSGKEAYLMPVTEK